MHTHLQHRLIQMSLTLSDKSTSTAIVPSFILHDNVHFPSADDNLLVSVEM